MREEEKMDLSLLDPSRDAARWERLVGSITAQAAARMAARQGPHPLLAQIAAWWRPSVAAAVATAGACALLWVGPTAAPDEPAAQPSREALDPTSALVDWAVRDQMPSAAQWYETFGGARDSTSR